MTAPIDFRTLFTLELAYVMRTLRRLGVAEADVEDVTHDVFLAVNGALATFDATRPVRPWLFAFALRFASNYRRRRREDLEPFTENVRDAAPLADEGIARAEERELVLAALDRLPLERRAVFVMHEIDGVPIVEAARILDIPEGTAHSRLAKARAEFAAAVTRLERTRDHGRSSRRTA